MGVPMCRPGFIGGACVAMECNILGGFEVGLTCVCCCSRVPICRLRSFVAMQCLCGAQHPLRVCTVQVQTDPDQNVPVCSEFPNASMNCNTGTLSQDTLPSMQPLVLVECGGGGALQDPSSCALD
eukprot:scaffold61455_cov21-Tisochrysis_lutea.AAC.3